MDASIYILQNFGYDPSCYKQILLILDQQWNLMNDSEKQQVEKCWKHNFDTEFDLNFFL